MIVMEEQDGAVEDPSHEVSIKHACIKIDESVMILEGTDNISLWRMHQAKIRSREMKRHHVI